MTSIISKWKAKGEYVKYGPFEYNVFAMDIGKKQASSDKTLLLIHGFPESSYSFHKIVDQMMTHFERVVLLDMIGYGLSDKPSENYAYSLFEQADVVMSVWNHFGIKGGHMLSHDMGDSVATEIIARQVNNILPLFLSDGLHSVTFTNGSMVLELADLRITQKLLLSKYGSMFKGLVNYKLFSQQVVSAHGNDNLSKEDIKDLWELNSLKEGHKKSYLTIKYLNDRKRFEKTRWLPALGKCKLPIHLCWGNDDNVARLEMAHYLKANICPNATLSVMNSIGHFCQLGSPKIWCENILDFYRSLV